MHGELDAALAEFVHLVAVLHVFHQFVDGSGDVVIANAFQGQQCPHHVPYTQCASAEFKANKKKNQKKKKSAEGSQKEEGKERRTRDAIPGAVLVCEYKKILLISVYRDDSPDAGI